MITKESLSENMEAIKRKYEVWWKLKELIFLLYKSISVTTFIKIVSTLILPVT